MGELEPGRRGRPSSRRLRITVFEALYQAVLRLYLSILSPAQPDPRQGRPRTLLDGRAWAEILKPAKIIFGPSMTRNVVFSYFTL
jgi:hypothetical protein